MKKHSFKLEFYFSLIIFAIMTSSVLVIAPFFILARNRGFFNGLDLVITASLLYLFSIIAGVIISAIVGRKILFPIRKLSKATQKVADGNFDTRLEENSRVGELRQMAKDFNIMVAELGETQTLRADFISGMSHEFKTPLASIEGYAQLLKDTSLTEEERNDYAERICAATKRLSRLSANILKITRLEGQEIITDRAPFRLDEQIRQSILMLENEWQKKNIELDIDLCEITYFSNSELLEHIWSNLLSNAFKYSENGGKVSITLKKDGSDAVCTVRDTGIGMDSETLKHIFDKFFQADTDRRDRGNGLGLTLALRAAELCGGSISAESMPGLGSCFTVRLPLASR